MERRLRIGALAWIALVATTAYASEHPPLLVIYDSSNSMWGELQDQTRKYEAGRQALADAFSRLPEDRQVALRAYGHRDAESCTDTELLVGFDTAKVNAQNMNQAVANIRPTGKTPISYSLTQGLTDLPDKQGEMLLISDGLETCDVDPCSLVDQWQEANVNVRVHVVGVGLNDLEREAMACVARTTQGTYLDANNMSDIAEAITRVGTGDNLTPKEAEPNDQPTTYALKVNGRDASGRTYVIQGTAQHLEDSTEMLPIRSYGRTPLPGPGSYRLIAGALLKDGSTFQPTTLDVNVTDPGDTVVEIVIAAPASVRAEFNKAGQRHPGSLVTASLNGQTAFSFRASDTALAAPGTYDFHASPEPDNQMQVTAVLTAGQETVLTFDMVSTVRVEIAFALPDGSQDQRVVELWQNDERRYRFHGGHGAHVIPGNYELRSPDDATPVEHVEITIEPEDKRYAVPIEAGYVVLTYTGNPEDLFGNADRGQLKSLSRRGSTYLPAGRTVAAAPGNYVIQPHDAAGYFEPIEVSIANGETTHAEIQAKPTGALVVTYKPGNYLVQPDRAFVEALEEQPIRRSYLTPGTPVRLLPGRYRVTGWSRVGEITPVDISVTARETTAVELALTD